MTGPLFQALFILFIVVQAKERQVGMEKCKGNNCSILGLFTSIFPNTWLCVKQPSLENWTLQLLSANSPI